MSEPSSGPSGFGGRRRKRARASLFVQGEPLVWLMGGGLVIAIAMIAGLLGLVAAQGFSTFIPRPVARFSAAGKVLMGEIERAEERPGGAGGRRLGRVGNFELTGEHYVWIDDAQIASEEQTPLPIPTEFAFVVQRVVVFPHTLTPVQAAPRVVHELKGTPLVDPAVDEATAQKSCLHPTGLSTSLPWQCTQSPF